MFRLLMVSAMTFLASAIPKCEGESLDDELELVDCVALRTTGVGRIDGEAGEFGETSPVSLNESDEETFGEVSFAWDAERLFIVALLGDGRVERLTVHLRDPKDEQRQWGIEIDAYEATAAARGGSSSQAPLRSLDAARVESGFLAGAEVAFPWREIVGTNIEQNMNFFFNIEVHTKKANGARDDLIPFVFVEEWATLRFASALDDLESEPGWSDEATANDDERADGARNSEWMGSNQRIEEDTSEKERLAEEDGDEPPARESKAVGAKDHDAIEKATADHGVDVTSLLDAFARVGELPMANIKECQVFDYFGQGSGGLRNFACHMASRVSYQGLVKLFGKSPFRTGPHTKRALETSSRFSFGHYDPSFVAWLEKKVVPVLTAPELVQILRPAYDAYARNIVWVMDATHKKLESNPQWLERETQYYEQKLKSRTLPEYDYERYFYFMFDGYTTLPAGIDLRTLDEMFSNRFESSPYGGNEVKTAVGFWVRRSIDGTADSFYRCLESVKNAYER